MNAYSFVNLEPLTIKSPKISYGDMDFNNMRVREVFIDGKQNGEYHVFAKTVEPATLCMMLKTKFEKFIVNMIDPSGVLCLEYPISVIVKDEMSQSCMLEILEGFDKEMTQFLEGISQ